jgi:DNA-binding MarR family transcriptional regulator
MPPPDLGDAEYQALAEFRYLVRRFLRVSEEAARNSGLEPQQHQLLLAVRGMPHGRHTTVGELAERMQVRPHSLVELIDRAAARGLVRRVPSERDRRQVIVKATPEGERLLRLLSLQHQAELSQAGPELIAALNAIISSVCGPVARPAPARRPRRRAT